MKRNRKSQEENLPKSKQNIWTGYGNFGYSDKALSALERGQYDQLTGRDPVYRTSQDQTKPAKQNVVPALEGITRSDAWQSSFGRKKSSVDTANARSKYEQRIGHVTPDMAQKNLSNKGYSSTHKDIDFSKLDDIELSYLEADEMRRDDERAKQERHRGVKAGSPADKLYTWLDSLDNIDTEEDKIARSQRYIDKYGASRDEVIDAYKQYKEGLERQKRIEHPYLEGLKDFPSALRRGLEQGAAWASDFMFPNSDLDQMLHSDTALKKSKEVEKKRDYSRNSYKATDSDRNNLETYYSVGDLLTSAAEGNLLTGGFGVANPSTGFAMSVEPSKAARVIANAVPSYGLEAENKYRAAKREGIDEDRAKELANTSGLIAGALGAASALGAGSAAANSGKSAIRSILESGAKSGGVAIGRQGAEELADKLLLGNQSTFDRSVQNYMAQGMSEEEAGKQAGLELATRILGAGAGGFLLGAGSETVGNIFSKGASKLANNAADDLNTVWDFQKALPQNEVPLLPGSSEPTTAVTGATYNSVPALADNIYPIQMPGTNGVINLPGETAPIMLPDLAAQSAPAVKSKVMAESRAPIPRLIKKLEGEELVKAQKQIADNKRQITTSNERMKAIINDKSNYRAGKLKKAASQQVKAIKKEIANYKNDNKLIERQIKGGVKPVTEYLDYADNRLLNGFKSDVKTIGKQIGDTELAKRVLTNLDKYVESGDKADLREYAMELWQLNNVATEKGVVNPEETDLFMSGMSGLDRVFQKSRALNPTTEEAGASAPATIQSETDRIKDFMAKKVGRNDSIEMENGQVIEKYSMKEMKSIVKDAKDNGLPEGFQLDIRYKDGSEAYYSSGDDTSNIKLTNIDSVIWRNDSTDAYAGNNVSIYPDDNSVENAYWRMALGEAPQNAEVGVPTSNNVPAEAKELSNTNAFLTDEDTNDYLRAGNHGFHQNRYDAMMNGEPIMVRSAEELESAITNIIAADKSKLTEMQPIGVMRVSENVANQLKDLDPSVDASKYFFQLEPNDVWHAYNGHKDPQRDYDLPMSPKDMVSAISRLNEAKVVDVIQEKGKRKLAKLIIPGGDNDEYYSVQVISKGDGALSLKTLMKIKKGSMDAIEDSKSPNAIRSHTTSPNNVPSVAQNVKSEAPDNGYWNRILGDKEFLALEAQKQNVDPQTLVDYANKNLGYDVAPTNNVPNGGNNVPPSNNVPPVDRPEPPKGMKERGMSRHMGDEEKMIVDIPQEVRDDFINDPDMYEALSNKATSEKALNIYNEHPDDREAIFRDMLTQYDPAALPLGQMIAKDYSAKGNHAMAAQIFRDMGERLTKAGQFSQASILTMLKNDPLTAQEYAQKAVDKLNMQGRKEFGKKWNNMSLTKEELDAFNEIDPGDEKALAALYDKIGQRLGREYPTTLMEKLLEGRKVAMLFNVRTISRNFFANPPTLGMRYMADKVEAVGQTIAHLIDPTFKKTQSLNSGGIGKKLAKEFVKSERYQQLVHGVDEKHMVPDLKSEIIHHKQMYKGTAAEKFIDTWAGNAFNSISDALYEAGKIKSNPHIKGGIQAINEKAFNKSDVQSILETIRNTTYKLLDVTDSPFVKKNFSQRLASYLNAQGITNIKDIPQEAIDIAWNEALKATYKDDSWMVKALSGVKGGIEKIPGIGKPLSQGLIPFLQAPGNIAARMVDYSPINLTKGIGQIIKGAAKKDHNTIRKGIEAAAKGLTGSALAVLGMKLYKSGILTGDYSQDNKEKSFQQRNGFKPWSLHVDGNYFSFNWMQPFAQSIMAGILAQQAIDNADQFDSDVLRHFGIEGSTAGKAIGAAYQSGKSAVNSWFDESPLGDLTKLFSGSYFDRDIAQNIVDVGEDFAGAMYPATGNAAAKTIDTTKRNTKDPSNRFSTFVNEQMAKVPWLSEKLPAAYDTWGEEIKYSDSPVEAAFQRFVYPGEYSSDSSDPLDVEIQRLFNATSDNRAFPLYAANKVGDKTLNNKEKSEYQKDMGQRAKQFAQAFVNSDRYKEMDDANRVETLNTLYYTSKAITERDVFGKPVADSSQYKKYIQAYDDAGGGKKGVEAVVNFSEAKSAMKAGNISASSNLGKQVEKAAKEGDTKTVEKITNAAQSVEDLGFTKAGPKETYIKASSIDPSLSLEEFGKTYREIDTNNNQGLSQKEVINYLNVNKVPEVKGLKMWDMYAPHGKKVPYVKEDGTWGAH